MCNMCMLEIWSLFMSCHNAKRLHADPDSVNLPDLLLNWTPGELVRYAAALWQEDQFDVQSAANCRQLSALQVLGISVVSPDALAPSWTTAGRLYMPDVLLWLWVLG